MNAGVLCTEMLKSLSKQKCSARSPLSYCKTPHLSKRKRQWIFAVLNWKANILSTLPRLIWRLFGGKNYPSCFPHDVRYRSKILFRRIKRSLLREEVVSRLKIIRRPQPWMIKALIWLWCDTCSWCWCTCRRQLKNLSWPLLSYFILNMNLS